MHCLLAVLPNMGPAALNPEVGKPFGREYYFADSEALPLE